MYKCLSSGATYIVVLRESLVQGRSGPAQVGTGDWAGSKWDGNETETTPSIGSAPPAAPRLAARPIGAVHTAPHGAHLGSRKTPEVTSLLVTSAGIAVPVLQIAPSDHSDQVPECSAAGRAAVLRSFARRGCAHGPGRATPDDSDGRYGRLSHPLLTPVLRVNQLIVWFTMRVSTQQ
jgi:hypothetical protein